MVIKEPTTPITRRTPSPPTTNSPQTPLSQTFNSAAADTSSRCHSFSFSEYNEPDTSTASLSTAKPPSDVLFSDTSFISSTNLEVPAAGPKAARINGVKYKMKLLKTNSHKNAKRAILRSNFLSDTGSALFSLSSGCKFFSTSAIPSCSRKNNNPSSCKADMTSFHPIKVHHARNNFSTSDELEMGSIESSHVRSPHRCREDEETISPTGHARGSNSPGRCSPECKLFPQRRLFSRTAKGHLTRSGTSPVRRPSFSRSLSNLVLNGNFKFHSSDFGKEEPSPLIDNQIFSSPGEKRKVSHKCSEVSSSSEIQPIYAPRYSEDKERIQGDIRDGTNRFNIEKHVEGGRPISSCQTLTPNLRDCRPLNPRGLCKPCTAQCIELAETKVENLSQNHIRHTTTSGNEQTESINNSPKTTQLYAESIDAKNSPGNKDKTEETQNNALCLTSSPQPRLTVSNNPRNFSFANGRLNDASQATSLPSRAGRCPSPSDQQSGPGISRAKLKTVKMTVTVVICYIVCWAPFFVGQMWAAFDEKAYEGHFLAIILLLASVNSCTNPWIYTVFSDSLCRRTDQILRVPCRCVVTCCSRLVCLSADCRLLKDKPNTTELSSPDISGNGRRSSVKFKAKRASLSQFGGSLHTFVGSKGSNLKRLYKSPVAKNGRAANHKPDECCSNTQERSSYGGKRVLLKQETLLSGFD